MSDFWSSLSTTDLRSEANVELRLVIPLLRALGYSDEDIDAKFPVVFQEGRQGRRPEADFVCFHGPLHIRDTSLLVVEAKRPGEALPDGKSQGESYASNLRAPLLLLTNGEALEIWQLQKTQDSVCVLATPVFSLPAKRGEIERLLSKQAVLDYCKTFQVKTILEASADYGRFETAELSRILRHERQEASIDRTLVRGEQASLEFLASEQLLDKCPHGAIIVASSGYGKTTLCRRLLRKAIEERQRTNRSLLPFDVPLPDLELSNVSVLDFMLQRLSAHCPNVVSVPALQMILRDQGGAIFCDGFDRTTPAFQKKVAVELAQLLRDYPLVQLFVFARGASRPALPLPLLELLALSDDQVRELEGLILSEGNSSWFSIIGMLPPTLRSLCEHPLLLRQILGYWKRNNDFPRQIDRIFRSWLDNVLETEPNDHASSIRREQALTLVAQATVDAPIARTDALTLFDRNNLPAGILNELIGCDALHIEGAVIEVRHEALADYLRTTALVAKTDNDVLALIPALTMPADSFFPVLLIAQLRTRELQSAFWKRLSEAGLSRYLDALRYRFDLTSELESFDADSLSRHFLEDLLDGIETPLDSFFPKLRGAVMDHLIDVGSGTLAATGMVPKDRRALGYKLHPLEETGSRVTVAPAAFPGILRGVNLDLSRFRIDCARLLGMTLLRDTVLDAVKHQDLTGGPIWAAERLIGRVRYLAEKRDVPFTLTDDFDKLEAILAPHADAWVAENAFFGGERFSIQSLLDDIAVLRADGQTALDPWWRCLGWDESAVAQSDETVRRLLDEEYRRVQLAYCEVVTTSLPILAGPASYFAALPVRWSFTVPPLSDPPTYRGGCWAASPVAAWKNAGADVVIASKAAIATEQDWNSTLKSLGALGRPHAHIPRFTGSMAFLPRYDGTQWNGHFDGATPVVHEVCSWLKEEVESLFRPLPGSDGAF